MSLPQVFSYSEAITVMFSSESGRGTRQGHLHMQGPLKARKLRLNRDPVPASPAEAPPLPPRGPALSVGPASAASPSAPRLPRLPRTLKMAAAVGRLLRASVSGCRLGDRRGDTAVALGTCFPDGTPLPCGLRAFRRSWRMSAGSGPGGLLLHRPSPTPPAVPSPVPPGCEPQVSSPLST